jgi:hypothetical protein
MGNSYERINSRAEMELLFLRAKTMGIYEQAFVTRRSNDERYYPRNLQVLVPENTRVMSTATYMPKWAHQLRDEIQESVQKEHRDIEDHDKHLREDLKTRDEQLRDDLHLAATRK